jgi:hypothetical protein
MSRRSVVSVVAVLFAGLVPFGASPARAADRDTHCLARFDVTLAPGLSMTPSSGTLTTGGETGTNSCDGTVRGFTPTGTATRGESGRYGVEGPSSCTDPAGVAEWTITFTVPTTLGPRHFEFPVRGPYGPLKGDGVYGGTFTGKEMHGHYTVTVLQGDCVTSPITKVHLECDEWIVNET